MKNQDILVHPERYTYALRHTRNGGTKNLRKDGTRGPWSGPYWYANQMIDGQFRTHYIGKELPEVCRPYAPDTNYMDSPSTKKRGQTALPRRGASDSILEALDRGEQVVLDLDMIAKDCNAYIDMIGQRKYLLYRDKPTNGQ